MTRVLWLVLALWFISTRKGRALPEGWSHEVWWSLGALSVVVAALALATGWRTWRGGRGAIVARLHGRLPAPLLALLERLR